jgi:hypothetical protein
MHIKKILDRETDQHEPRCCTQSLGDLPTLRLVTAHSLLESLASKTCKASCLSHKIILMKPSLGHGRHDIVQAAVYGSADRYLLPKWRASLPSLVEASPVSI